MIVVLRNIPANDRIRPQPPRPSPPHPQPPSPTSIYAHGRSRPTTNFHSRRLPTAVDGWSWAAVGGGGRRWAAVSSRGQPQAATGGPGGRGRPRAAAGAIIDFKTGRISLPRATKSHQNKTMRFFRHQVDILRFILRLARSPKSSSRAQKSNGFHCLQHTLQNLSIFVIQVAKIGT